MSAARKRKKKSGSSLFYRYMAFFVIIEVVSFTAVGIVLLQNIVRNGSEQRLQSIDSETESLAFAFSQYYYNSTNLGDNSASGIIKAINKASADAALDIFITDPMGRVTYCREMAKKEAPYTGECTCEIHRDRGIPGEIFTSIIEEGSVMRVTDFAGTFSEMTFVTAITVYDKSGSAVGIVYGMEPYVAGMRSYYIGHCRTYILAIAAVIALTITIAYFYTKKMTAPLTLMRDATSKYSKGDLSHRIEYDEKRFTVTEFNELTASLNSMADSLERNDEALKSFVANVSHELKTPMTTIGGFVDAILDGTIEGEKADEYLHIVSDEVKRLANLVVAMLNLSKIEAGQLTLNPVRIDLMTMLGEILITFEQKINAKNISIENFDDLRPAYIEADKDMINQVFYNLIDNAVKFAGENGKIFFFIDQEDDTVTVRIRNTGGPISEEDLKRIFERFYKADKSRSKYSSSAGLGLYIVKRVVTLHDGEVSVRNVGGNYTEFSVKLKRKVIIDQ